MINKEKLNIIEKYCDEYWEEHGICFGCPLWEYMVHKNIRICSDIDIDKSYKILMGVNNE